MVKFSHLKLKGQFQRPSLLVYHVSSSWNELLSEYICPAQSFCNLMGEVGMSYGKDKVPV